MFEFIISPLAIILSLCTSTGILLHETKLDKVASLTILSAPSQSARQAVTKPVKLEGMPHTHVERVEVNPASKELKGHNPLVSPRRDDKKYRLQNKVARGVHAFDSYHLPLGLVDNGQFSF